MISPRLEMTLSLAPKVKTYCDVGTDHGYIAIELARLAEKVVALDVNKMPLERARKNIREAGLENKIDTRLSDGFSALDYGEAECAVIAGMGGELIAKILKGDDKGIKYFVLQPQSSIYELRRYLSENGCRIDDERLCREGERFYVAMLVTKGFAPPLSEAELRTGPVIGKRTDALAAEYFASERRKLEQIIKKIGDSDSEKRQSCQRLVEIYNGGKI